MSRKFLLRICLSFALFFGSVHHFSFAAVYPWVQMSSNDIRMIPDAELEAEIRLELIRNAHNSLDIVIWDQREDEVIGMPILKAIREAADRGVKVRFLLSWSGHMIEDIFNRSGRYLTEPQARNPVEFMIVGGSSMWGNGWGYLDGIHEKLLIVDQKTTMITGRGHADQYLKWMDTAFVLKGPLVEQTVQGFESLWKTVHLEANDSQDLQQLSESPAPSLASIESVPTSWSEEKSKELYGLLQWVSEPRTPGPPEEQIQGRLLHHDFLNQMRQLATRFEVDPSDISYENRFHYLQDPIVNEVIDLISRPSAREFRFYALSVTLNPRLKEAILKGLEKGLKVSIFTNGKEAQTQVVPVKIPFGWFLSLPDLDDLMQAGAKGIGLEAQDESSAIYLHRKMEIVDDTVLFGSHNLNLSSTAESDEMDIEIQSADFAKKARYLFNRSFAKNGRAFEARDIHSQRERTVVAAWFAEFLKGLY